MPKINHKLFKNSKKFVKNNKILLLIVAISLLGFISLKLMSANTVVKTTNCSSGGAGQNGYLYPFCREDAGAKLPINYSLSILPSDAKYVSVDGNDANSGASSSPVRNLAKAISLAKNGDTIVVKNGTYREGNLSVSSSKSLRIIAYPGHSPIFRGSVAVTSSWAGDGTNSYISYTPRPVTTGSGIDFASGMNLTGDKVGKYPDQVWIGNTQLKQVTNKSELKDGVFWVDQANKRLYLTANDSKKNTIEVSGSSGRFIDIQSPNSSLEGLTIERYSNGGADYGVVLFQNLANSSGLRNVKISDVAYMALMFTGRTTKTAPNPILKDNFADSVTIQNSGWMGIVGHYTDNLTVNGSSVKNMNLFGEFASSPQSGGIKANRTRYTKITNSDFSNNNSYAIWFDMSNKGAEIANNIMIDNTASALFYEISDGLTLVNNYVKTSVGGSQAIKTAGSSGLRIVNNTIIGGKDPIGVYTDSRSRPGCANPALPYCSGEWTQVRDEVRPYDPLIDFYPRIDLIINNIIAYPSSSNYCGKITAICITTSNSSATAPIETIIHKANPSRGIPETKIDSNVYVNNGALIVVGGSTYNNLSDFTSAMSKSPVSISGIEQNGKQNGNYVNTDGTPTQNLVSVYNQATAVPSDALINKYVSAGFKKIGVIAASMGASDTTSPTISITSPLNNASVPAGVVTVNATATDNVGVTKVEFFVDNNTTPTITDDTSPYTSGNSISLTAGSHTITAVAYDAAGNPPARATINITVTSTQPQAKACDFNNDGIVELKDLSILLGNWKNTVAPNTKGDCSGQNNVPDSFVDLFDLSKLLGLWKK